jgi:hypothetical protein
MGHTLIMGDRNVKYLIFTTEIDAQAFQLRGDMNTGYPHAQSGTLHAMGYEKAYDQNRWAASVGTVWSHYHGRDYNMETEMLTPEEAAELKTFQYLIDEGWFPPE